MLKELDREATVRVAQREARVKHFGEGRRSEVLQRSGDDPEEHAMRRAHLFARLADEVRRGEREIAQLFGTAFVSERLGLEASKRTVESLGDLHVAKAFVVTPADPTATESVSTTSATPVHAPHAVQVPTYLQVGGQTPAEIDPEATLPPVSRHEATLPFAGGKQGEVSDALRSLLAEARAMKVADDALASDVEETAFLGGVADVGPATPFDAGAAGGAGGWSLAAYASFLAELSRDATQAAAVRAQHGIANEAEQRAIGARFAEAFEREPAMRARFEVLVAQARARGAR